MFLRWKGCTEHTWRCLVFLAVAVNVKITTNYYNEAQMFSECMDFLSTFAASLPRNCCTLVNVVTKVMKVLALGCLDCHEKTPQHILHSLRGQGSRYDWFFLHFFLPACFQVYIPGLSECAQLPISYEDTRQNWIRIPLGG